MGSSTRRWRGETLDFFQLILVPALAATLPWRFCFRVLRRIAVHTRIYEAETRPAWNHVNARGVVGDARDWTLRRRLTTLVDHADYFLSRTRPNSWMQRHVRVDGQWPAPGQPGLICTFHWGAGMWGLRHARQSGLRAHALVAALDGAHFQGRSVLHAYAKARTNEVARALRCPTVDVSSSLRPAIRVLRANEQVVAAIDVPTDQVAASEPITLCGRAARVPRGLLRLAVDQKLPVTVYLTGIDMATGDRMLKIRQLGVHDDVAALASDVFALLDQALAEDSAAWHFWSQAPRIFVDDRTA